MAARVWRILLAEDDRFLRKAAEATLRQNGFTVLSGRRARSAATRTPSQGSGGSGAKGAASAAGAGSAIEEVFRVAL